MVDNSSANPVVLSYFNSLLRQSDVSLLESNNWLNDNLIGFHYEYLENSIYPELKDKIAFIGPDVAQLIKMNGPAELTFILESLELGSKEIIFLPVNNNQSAQHWGGSHWSTLVYIKKDKAFFHYDSFGGGNNEEAGVMARKLQGYLNSITGETTHTNIIDGECPQQQNGCDCGVYVMCITEQLCHRYLKDDPSPLQMMITPEFVSNKRSTLKSFIEKLSAEQND